MIFSFRPNQSSIASYYLTNNFKSRVKYATQKYNYQKLEMKYIFIKLFRLGRFKNKEYVN